MSFPTQLLLDAGSDEIRNLHYVHHDLVTASRSMMNSYQRYDR